MLNDDDLKAVRQELIRRQGSETMADNLINAAERGGLTVDDLKECSSVPGALVLVNRYSAIGQELERADHCLKEVDKIIAGAEVEAKRQVKRDALESLIRQAGPAYWGPPGVRDEKLHETIQAAYADLAREDGGEDFDDTGEAPPDTPGQPSQSREELEAMMKDPRYSNPSMRDELFVAEVEDGFRALAGEQEKTPAPEEAHLMGAS